MLLHWVDQHKEGWPDRAEANIKSMMLALLVGFGELPPKLCMGAELQLTGQIYARRTALRQPLREAAQRLPCLSHGQLHWLLFCGLQAQGEACWSSLHLRGGLRLLHSWLTSRLWQW